MAWDSNKVLGQILNASDWNNQVTYIKALIPDHLVAKNHDLLHTRQHAINAAADHTGVPSATENNFLSFNASGLPKDSGNKASDFSISSHTHAHSVITGQTADDHHNEAHTLASHSSKAHSELSGVGINDHHARSHTLASHSTKPHSALTGVGANDHHAESHTLASHSSKSHTVLTDKGTNTHVQIDTHIASNHVTAFNTRTGAVTPANNDYTWAQINKSTSSIDDITTKTHSLLSGRSADDHTLYSLADGTRAFIGTVGGITPTATAHLATKGYVDGLIQGLDWQESVLDRYDPTGGLPGAPGTGDRYISTATANGWTDKYVYEYNGSSWDEVAPTEGYATWVEDENKLYVYNGSTWVKFGSTLSHDVLMDVSEDDHHNKQHAIDSATDHTSSITQNNLMDADANGLPDDSGISVADVNAAITHITNDGSDHSFIDQDVTSSSAPAFTADNFSDGGSNAIITTAQETNFQTAYDHSQNNNQAHTDYLRNNASDITTGVITCSRVAPEFKWLNTDDSNHYGRIYRLASGRQFIFANEVETPGTSGNVGNEAINRASALNATATYIDLNTTSDGAGSLVSVEVHASITGNIKIKMFRSSNGTWIYVGESEVFEVTGGVKTTRMLTSPIAGVQIGDCIGWYRYSPMAIDISTDGTGIHYIMSDVTTDIAKTSWTQDTTWKVSIYGVITGSSSINQRVGFALRDAESASYSYTFDLGDSTHHNGYGYIWNDVELYEDKRFYLRDSGIYITSGADSRLDLVADGSVTIGDGGATNYTSFASDGIMTMAGTARVTKEIVIGAGLFHKGASAPDDVILSNSMHVLAFDKNVVQHAHYTMIIPPDLATGTEIAIQVDWAFDDVEAGNYTTWVLEYTLVADGEDPAKAVTRTFQKSVISTGNNDKQIHMTFGTGIIGAVADDTLQLRFFRDSDASYDTDDLDQDSWMLAVHLHYVSDKLGTPL